MTDRTALCVVQARMGSSRLPGKVLADVAGEPMLGLMLGRLQRLPDVADVQLVVATSDRVADDPVAELARDRGIEAVRGPEDDVLGRFVLAHATFPSATIVRLTADCPLADPEIVRATLDSHYRYGADYTSNTLVRTFPDGLDVEVLTAAALLAAADEASAREEREHVTPFVYRRPSRFLLAQVLSDAEAGAERWTIDTAEDLAWLRDVATSIPDLRTIGWRELLESIGRVPRADKPHLIPLRPPTAGRGPFVRRWSVHDGLRIAGTALVTVDSGVGTLEVDVPAWLTGITRVLVAEALRADLQVTELVEPPAHEPTSPSATG